MEVSDFTEHDIFTPEFFQNPFPGYAWLREFAPVHPVNIPSTPVRVWLISRHADVQAAFLDQRLSSDYRWAKPDFHAAGLAFGSGTVFERAISNLDPPEHAKMRRLAAYAFTPKRIQQWEKDIRKIAGELLDRIPPGEPIDVMDQLAAPLSVRSIAAVLGVPPPDHASLRKWGDLVFTANPDEMKMVPDALKALLSLTNELIVLKRKEPADDLLSTLIAATDGDECISADELVAVSMSVLIAGYETTIRLIGDTLLALLDHPEQLALLQNGQYTVDTAIEEVLRYYGPQTSALWRFTNQDTEIAGTTIPAHEPVLLLVASAHRDAQRYADPDTFDITRTDKRHLAFGHGIHHCIGAALARMESKVLVTCLIERNIRISLAIPRAQIYFKPSLVLRGPDVLPMIFSPSTMSLNIIKHND